MQKRKKNIRDFYTQDKNTHKRKSHFKKRKNKF